MKLKFNESKHEYKLGDKVLPSVTKVIKSFFEPFDKDYWAKFIAMRDSKTKRQVLQDWKVKRDWGSKVHQLIEDHINDKRIKNYPNEVSGAIDFLKTFNHKEITSELRVHSNEWLVAGTIDVVLETPEGVILLDWKTTKRPIRKENSFQQAKPPINHIGECNYNVYALQLNMYKALFEEAYGKKVIEIGFVILPESGPVEYFKVPDYSHEVYLMLDHWQNWRD